MRALIDAIDELPRPLVIQCTTANRSGIALLLWLAHARGYTAECADRLVKDLELDTVKLEALAWLREKLPKLSPGFHGPLIEHAPEVLQFWDPQSHTLTYLVRCAESREAVLIDPVLGQVDRDLSVLKDLGLRLKYIIYTHDGQEHSSAGVVKRHFREDQHDVQILVSTAFSHAELADRRVRNGEVIKFGKLAMEVRATPGLNDGSMAFTLQTGTAAFVFTGDTLWVRGGAKRDYQRHNLRKLQESVRRQILTLPDETIVCPGHDNKGRSVSTVEEERLFNSRFSQPISEFEDYMTQEPPSAKSLAERPFLPPQSKANAAFGVAAFM
ncbi:ETHE1 [Symbiodinium pilosum]|uniref:ETHE1 protein n=1 Tax=Symbiodinium pilosum TaxID=2952 RepID=A0A812QRB5_SYMPI|nr:ETHE1 [Symbiodinium pilosum]